MEIVYVYWKQETSLCNMLKSDKLAMQSHCRTLYKESSLWPGCQECNRRTWKIISERFCQFSSFEADESFEKNNFSKWMTINNNRIKLEPLHNNIKNYDMVLPGVLSNKFVNNANITEEDKQLVHTTFTEEDMIKWKSRLRRALETQ